MCAIALSGVMPMPPASSTECVALDAMGKALRGAPTISSSPTCTLWCMALDPPCPLTSLRTPNVHAVRSAGSPAKEYDRIRPPGRCTSTWEPAVASGNRAASGSTSSKAWMPSACQRIACTRSLNKGRVSASNSPMPSGAGAFMPAAVPALPAARFPAWPSRRHRAHYLSGYRIR